MTNFANFADRGKRLLALTLVTALSVTGNGVESFAAKPDFVSDGGKGYIYLEKATMPEEIQKNDVFYVATTDNPLQQAKEELTGISSDREAMTGSGNDMIEMMSQVSNLLTETVAGTTLTLDFSPGEKEKEIVITPKDNRKSDGSRFFYLVLSEPSDGMKNSSISESIFTIQDDEPEVKASISFDAESFRAENGEVQVRLIREGALTQTVAVHMTSKDGLAKAGENYEGVDAEVVFPFGVKERNLKFTAKSDGLKTDADYTLSIKESSGAVTGEVAEAKVVIPKETKVKRVKASDRGKKISDVRLGNPITHFSTSVWDIDLPGYTWQSYSNSGEKGAGKSSFSVNKDNQIYLYGHDTAAGDSGNGIVQANSKHWRRPLMRS